MKLHSATFNDKEELATATVEVTAEELTLIYMFVGRVAPSQITAHAGIEWGNAFYDIGESVLSIGSRLYKSSWPDLGFRLTVEAAP